MTEKTEKPTQKKLRDARKRGEVTKSRELTSLGMFIALLGFLWFGTKFMAAHVLAIMEHALTAAAPAHSSEAWQLLREMQDMGRNLVYLLAPLLALSVICAVLVGAAQTRGVLSMGPITPKFERMNPGKGLKNIFSTRQLFELGKLFVKCGLLLGAFGVCVVFSLGALVQMVYAQPMQLLRIAGGSVMQLMAWAALIYALAAGLDYAHQRYEFLKEQKMTVAEVRRENRDTEGDPHIKAHRRVLGRQLAFSDVSGRVPAASVVIANPTHVCVALYYVPGKTPLPRVVAKGVDAMALRIRAEAERSGVPICEDPPLARRLFSEVPLDQYINEGLIDAIAEVMRWATEADRRTRPAQSGSRSLSRKPTPRMV